MQPEIRQTIVDSFMDLLAEQPWSAVTLEQVATRAGLTLGDLRGAYDTRFEIMEDFTRRVDRGILDAVDPDMAGEEPREKLFDILFSRIEALHRHKKSIGNLARAAWGDPILALALNRTTAVSMSWMLAAAGIGATGAGGALRAQGLALVWARVLRTWLHDDDAGLSRTMADLDAQLRRAERAAIRLERLRGLLPGSKRSRRRTPETDEMGGSDLAEAHPS